MPIPPKSVQSVARKALERRRELPPSRRGGTAVGVARARSLANGQNIPIETIKRMTSFFARHDTPAERRNRRNDKNSKASVAWDLWGGNPGRRWAESIARRLG
jgi:hypothetical protein|tara:strand:+ start:329 stop:637 length:309 start_codon:yes stop_codon:yes gene_type:complete